MHKAAIAMEKDREKKREEKRLKLEEAEKQGKMLYIKPEGKKKVSLKDNKVAAVNNKSLLSFDDDE
jgi:hypothetical protein